MKEMKSELTKHNGANFVSSLQKANSEQNSKQYRWLEQCYEIVISVKIDNNNNSGDIPVIPIDGGSDAGMFCVVGAQFDPSRIIYHRSTTISNNNDNTNNNNSKSMEPGDIILAVDGYELSGYTKRDAITLCNACLQSHSHVRLHLSPPHALVTSSTMLSSFLAISFAMDSSEYALQEKIRENVYQRVVPCTTRLPRAEEVDGVHYRFMNVPQFLALERSGQLLESGMYKGNHYGTPRPDPNSTALDPVFLEQFQLSSTDISQISDDACRIPPPLAPLSSFNTFAMHATTTASGTNGSNITTTSSSSSSNNNSSIGVKLNDPLQQLPTCSPPPPPPIRNSSITKNSNIVCNTNNININHGKASTNLLTLCTTENYLTKTIDNNNNNTQLNGLNELNGKLYLPRPKFSNDEASLWSPSEIHLVDDHKTTALSTASTTMSVAANTITITTTTNTNTTNMNTTTMSNHVNTSMTNGCSLIESFCDQTAYSVDKLDQIGEHVLPYGWEIVQDIKYGTFYIDHINKHTQYEPPTVEDFQLGEKVRMKYLSQFDTIHHKTKTNTTINNNHNIIKNVNNDVNANNNHDDSQNELGSSSINDNGRITPVTFCSDLKQLRGPLINTVLVKSPRGFGFTIIGGSDCNRSAFLQVKHLVPGGPASLNSQLAVGDVMVSVNGTNVLGYTHSQLVSLFQSIPVGASINLLVSQGYRLRREIGNDPPTHFNGSVSGNHLGATGFVSGVIDISTQNNLNNLKLGEDTLDNLPLTELHLVNSSRNSGVISSHSSISPTPPPSASSSSNNGNSSQELPAVRSSPSNLNGGSCVGKLRNSQRPEFLKVSIFKQTNGFGFTLADHIQGQHVKAISDPVRCGRLRVGDVIVEINDQRVKDMPHVEVVQILKQCPVGKEARLLVQRGGLYTSPLSLLDTELLEMNSLNFNEQRYRGNIANHHYINDFHVKSTDQQSNTSIIGVFPSSPPTDGTVNSNAINTTTINNNNLSIIYATPQPQRNHLSSRIGYHHRTSGSTGENSISSSSSSHIRAQTPDPYVDRRLGLDSPNHQYHQRHYQHSYQNEPSDLISRSNFDQTDYIHHSNNNNGNINNNMGLSVISDRRRRVHPVDDSVVGLNKDNFSPESPNSSTTYGSLLRPGRMLPLRHSQSSVSNRPNSNIVRSATAVTTSAMASSPAPLCMLPGEFLVHLKRQSTGFGFNLVGGAEENTQVSIGALRMGGSAQLSEVVRTGDKLISIDGVRVIGATHAEVVELLDRAAHTVGQVTLGLQRGKVEIDNLNSHSSSEPVDVVISRSEKSDGFGFFLTNTKPIHNSLNEHSNVIAVNRNNSNNNNLQNTEYIAQIVPGSQAERMGLLSVGDQILAVNGIPTCGLHHDEVVRLIRESGNHIALKILPYSGSASRGRKHPLPMRDSVEFPVTLFRGSRGFGFSIRGGQEFNRMPLVVLRIADGGAAQMDGHLKVGDELVEINGYSTIGMSHGQAIEIIQRGGNTMRLIVRRRSPRVKQSLEQQMSNGLTRVIDSRTNADKQSHRLSFNKHDSSSNWFQRTILDKNHSSSHFNQFQRRNEVLRWTIRK
ncbi:unnamed protein product [Schistosoma bovis]|nr:unnamed protein product [Schistosoma bovis]